MKKFIIKKIKKNDIQSEYMTETLEMMQHMKEDEQLYTTLIAKHDDTKPAANEIKARIQFYPITKEYNSNINRLILLDNNPELFNIKDLFNENQEEQHIKHDNSRLKEQQIRDSNDLYKELIKNLKNNIKPSLQSYYLDGKSLWPSFLRKRSYAYYIPNKQNRIIGENLIYWCTSTLRYNDNYALLLSIYICKLLHLKLTVLYTHYPYQYKTFHSYQCIAKFKQALQMLNIPLDMYHIGSKFKYKIFLKAYFLDKKHKIHSIITDDTYLPEYHDIITELIKKENNNLPCSLYAIDNDTF